LALMIRQTTWGSGCGQSRKRNLQGKSRSRSRAPKLKKNKHKILAVELQWKSSKQITRFNQRRRVKNAALRSKGGETFGKGGKELKLSKRSEASRVLVHHDRKGVTKKVRKEQ